MTRHDELISRRRFVRHTAAVGAGLAAGDALRTTQAATKKQQALISITLDLEMMARFPTWDQTHWNYHKGDLDEAAKRYSVAAARRVKARGGVIHFFVVGRVFEQPNVDWIKELVEAGHPLGNHTYDHVYVLAKETWNRARPLKRTFGCAPRRSSTASASSPTASAPPAVSPTP
jgi:hypothetical protein